MNTLCGKAARFALAAIATLLLTQPASAESSDARQLNQLFPKSTLQIATPDARLHTFKVWLADTNERRARGLMFVKELADDEGMLFIYPVPQRIAMWMKNTYIPLDMLFVDASGKVLQVAANTTPHSLNTIESTDDVTAVIELKASTAKRLHIAKGARVMHGAFATQK